MSRHTANRTFDEQDSEAGTREHVLLIDGQEVSPREYAHVMATQGYEWTEEEIITDGALNASRSFHILR